MMLLQKSQAQSRGLDTNAYAPIAKALHKIPKGDKGALRVKFDIAHSVATQKLAFTNYSVLCQFEAKHGVWLTITRMQARHSKISLRSQREQLVEKLTTIFSLLMDGSTDTANIDNEISLFCGVISIMMTGWFTPT